MILLPILFFITALIYASVGFGGGSTYNALLVLADIDYRSIPIIALTCNIIVVTGGVFFFQRAGHLSIRQTLPWIAFSIPAAWMGGYIIIPEIIFIWILGISLLLSAIQILLPERTGSALPPLKKPRYLTPVIGGALGFLAGITGIGGGIFLAPVLHFIRWDNAKKIAGACSLFILVNSIAGLTGQAMKNGSDGGIMTAISVHLPLLIAVLIGGQIGSWVGSQKINSTYVKKLTGCLVLYVALRLIYKGFILI